MTTSDEPPLCRRCGRLVILSRQHYDTFEGMHYVCFHYEYEHGETDVDGDCGQRGCPSGELPPAAPSAEAQALLNEVADALRRPYEADSPVLEFEQPGVLRVTTGGRHFRLVALDYR